MIPSVVFLIVGILVQHTEAEKDPRNSFEVAFIDAANCKTDRECATGEECTRVCFSGRANNTLYGCALRCLSNERYQNIFYSQYRSVLSPPGCNFPNNTCPGSAVCTDDNECLCPPVFILWELIAGEYQCSRCHDHCKNTDKWGRQLCKWDADCGKSNKTCILGTCRNPKSNAPRKCRKSSECDMNATCSKNGTCVCDTGYEWSPGFDICRTIDKQ